MTLFIPQPSRGFHGALRVSSDKSISHRALIFAALAEGKTRIKNLLLGEDVLRTLTILNQLGVKTSHTATTRTPCDELIVFGQGLHHFQAPRDILYCGNSGTTMRFMLGLLAAQPFSSRLTGDASLNRRPMERVMEPLRKMGAEFLIEETVSGRVITINPGGQRASQAIQYHMPIASAQVKTALLLAGLYVEGETTLTEPVLSRNHTEIMLQNMGAPIQVSGGRVTVQGPCQKALFSPNGGSLDIPADISSAAFFIVAGLIVPNSELVLTGVNLNPTRTGIIDVLREMGGKITVENEQRLGGEIVGDLRVCSSSLQGIKIGGELIPRLIDEIPILSLAAACAEGRTIVSNASELRVKETDRIKAICTELRKNGVVIEEEEDGFVIDGPTRFTLHTSRFTSYGDHRMAMMEAIAGLVLNQPIQIDDVDCVKTSFPNFFDLLNKLQGSREGVCLPAPNP